MKNYIFSALVIMFCGISCFNNAYANDADVLSRKIDSLNHISSASNDTSRMALLYELSVCDDLDVDSMLYYSKELSKEARRMHNARYLMLALRRVSYCSLFLNDFDRCDEADFEGLAVADSVGDVFSQAIFYESIGSTCFMRSNATMADDYYNKAYDIFCRIDNVNKQCDVLRNMAALALNYDMHEKASEYSYQAFNLYSQLNDSLGIAECYYLLASSYCVQYEVNRSPENRGLLCLGIDNYTRARNMCQKLSDDFNLAQNDIYITQAYTDLYQLESSDTRRSQILDSCKLFLDEAYAICTDKGYYSLLDMYKNARLGWLIISKRFGEAESYLDSLLVVYQSDLDGHGTEIEDVYSYYAELYEHKGDYKKCVDYKNLFFSWYRKNRQNDYAAKSAENMAEVKFNQQMRARENESLARELQYQSDALLHKIIIAFVIVILLLVVYGFRQSRKAIILLDEKNCELEQQKEEILVQNEDLEYQRDLLASANHQITDSINYASRIQNAALPSSASLNELFGEHFVFFRPKDIVSGDFYWASRSGNLRLLAAADCTGHGVPGAFVSMLGISILNDLAARIDHCNVSAGRLLDDMRNELKTALHQSGQTDENHDGMDLALLIFDSENQQIHFAGAFRPLFIYHEGSLSKIEADRMPVSAHLFDQKPFTDHVIPMHKGDMLYIFSDGIVDQFGYDDTKQKESKFSARRLVSLLDSVNQLPCDEQLQLIQRSVDQWRRVGSYLEAEQTDDNLMVGVRVV